MKLFISWSNPHAQVVAEALRDWLKDMIHALEPFVSSLDIAKGERGLATIAHELEGSRHGIICVNRANQNAPWLNFEAGSISKQVETSRVFPVLIDLPGSDLQGPLREFQYTELFSERDMLRLVESIWEACPDPNINLIQLRKNFSRLWPELMDALEETKETPSVELASAQEARSAEDKLDELLGLARQNQRRIDSLEGASFTGQPTRRRQRKQAADDFWLTTPNIDEALRTLDEINKRLAEEIGKPISLTVERPNKIVALVPAGLRIQSQSARTLGELAQSRGLSLHFRRTSAESAENVEES
ncbi:toll/interleukin-1 receptor domain-containing protein [Streptomyces canus]|uniref:toll/interleukin-1 receptor domain-containing protein n=1 Tax=Streptomyces canus TaxID=58343 RepID=UPI002259E43E|nr:toll/interleukin-1 receptor domain-containing protein [Streptomyces canus]MCX5260936.1 toll/interleukin-1 receptor domain-containing protein [Streptomyces canus]